MPKPVLYIIDGHSQVFKAYHAIQQLSTSAGIPTNAVYGFCQILHKLLRTRQPDYIMVAFDSGGPTFRHEMYSEYKANREAPPEDFSQQMELIIDILKGLRIPIIQKPGYEADDIIATVVRKATAEGFQTVVVTADKDLFQLVNEDTKVLRLDTDRETEFGRDAVKEKMGVFPEQIQDMLAMVGDTSDNVPGIAKVGPKTAATLLDQFGTLEDVLANTDKLKGKQKENIEAGRESAILSKRLVALDYEVPVEFEVQSFQRQQPDVEVLQPIYTRLEFKRFLDELDVKVEARETHYECVTDLAILRKFAAKALKAGILAWDTETDSLNTLACRLAGFSFSCEPDHAIYVPVGHSSTMGQAVPQLTMDQVFEVIDPLFRNPDVRKIGHNIKFDIKSVTKYGFVLDKIGFDTLLASYILNPDKRNHGLKDLGPTLAGVSMHPITDLIGTGRNQITFNEVELDKATPYACADADATLQVYHILDKRLDESGMRDLYERIEMPLINVLMDMELCGVRIDSPYFLRLGAEMQQELDRLSARVFEITGHPFNLASPKQVAQVLFEELKLKPGKQKKTGYSTDVEVLDELANEHEVPRLLLDYRQYEKLKSTYVDVLPTLVERSTGRIHTTYNQTIAATGRLSSSDPNLQNIPVRTELGRRIRRGFIPLQDGHLLLSADYSQIELRVLAHVSHDPALLRAYAEADDVHTLTASKVFGCSPGEVTYEMRDQAKVINFGIIYGMGAHGLSTRLKIPMAAAKQFIDEYFAAYAGVKEWLNGTLENARQLGFVSTLTGRRRYLADINSKNFNARSGAERVAVNAPIQGSSADMIKIAMINIHNWLKESDLRTRMIMQVHDELIFDVPESELEHVSNHIQELMKTALPLDVPIQVDLATGPNWADCK
ncbi:MAG: DNA polymerase I [Candidatus Sumerlaeaceae bacterium]|nr:DNA polymerase I [Candidatus Sumerlaeaceae bacterium]